MKSQRTFQVITVLLMLAIVAVLVFGAYTLLTYDSGCKLTWPTVLCEPEGGRNG